MYFLLFRQFLRTRTCQLGLGLVTVLGVISILIGKQFLVDQDQVAQQAVAHQKKHIERHIKQHGDDLGLLLYYLEFAQLNEVNPLAGLSIGQKDINPNVQSVTIRTLEGQKYDTDLVNPTKLLYGNLDLSFMLIYVFPLLVIAFTYNLVSEEEESGTWKMVRVMAKSNRRFLLAKWSVRLVVMVAVMAVLYVGAAWSLELSWNAQLLAFWLISLLYLLFWFVLSFWIVLWQQNSNFNALVLLTTWLLLVILLPAFVNNMVVNRYPIPEAFTTMITQRDGYHSKWDTNKRETMVQFYRDYPEYESFGYPAEEGFTWLWYYAMQHLGDAESREHSLAMQEKIGQRGALSTSWAQFIPSMHTQLALNDVAGTSLSHHMNFLKHTESYHEKTRMYFYPLIFTNQGAQQVDWPQFDPSYYSELDPSIDWGAKLLPLILAISTLLIASIFTVRKLN